MNQTTEQVDGGRPGQRLAKAVSYLVNPLVLPPVEFGLVLWHFGAGKQEIQSAVTIALIFFLLVPLAYITWMVRRGEAMTVEIRQRQARTVPFLVGIVSYLIGIALLSMTLHTARQLVLVLALLYPINTALITVINLRWKISVHVASIAGVLTALIYIAHVDWETPSFGILTLASLTPWMLLIPLLMWARIRSGAHTIGQVVGGALFGISMTLAFLLAVLRI